MSKVSLEESKNSLDKLGEQIIKEKALDVATQIEIFIKLHPRMKKEDLAKDPWLKQIAVQKVGETGYTAVHDDRGINYFHSNPQLVGTDLHDLADKLPAFWKILEASLKGSASGTYDWKDADGKIRPKYMYLAPVKGTDLIVASTTYIEEFSKPSRAIEAKMKQIEARFLDEYAKKFMFFYLIIFARPHRPDGGHLPLFPFGDSPHPHAFRSSRQDQHGRVEHPDQNQGKRRGRPSCGIH